MDDMDGIQTAKRLRQIGYLCPIIVLTANAYAADRVNAINAGCNDFLAKPLQVPELLYKLKLHLGLTWVYKENDAILFEKTAPQQLDQCPPCTILEELNAFVRIGDLFGLNQYLDELNRQNPEYQNFSHRILSLSKEFRVSAIKKLLNLSMEKLNSYD
jgi:CheY-like chemotaxis protein